MIFLRYLIKTLIYKYLNVTFHHQWPSLFILHMDLESQIVNSSDASSNNFDFDSETLHCTPINTMIDNFLEAPK